MSFHYINGNWEVVSGLLDFKELEGSHMGDMVGRTVFGTLKWMGITWKSPTNPGPKFTSQLGAIIMYVRASLQRIATSNLSCKMKNMKNLALLPDVIRLWNSTLFTIPSAFHVKVTLSEFFVLSAADNSHLALDDLG
ncbi:hypothetical protein BDK51DRAFT_26905 [Blyttiomyces helicus]|uniref:Uncharacterized protein n=1 Tax=Blyttiomyces helicus TaxID=388810 RepID=A0A4P9WFB8_9FUNG|nr:hypothetical protein BDK51DRAFT_26905 [Blyttiomyces helicus]|eukprot:RKO90535.1 hypothetical protein BDK51DRAFT_26905 [Blyttiomyces helicus]